MNDYKIMYESGLIDDAIDLLLHFEDNEAIEAMIVKLEEIQTELEGQL